MSNYFGLESYPRGRRGAPAKGVVRETVARVQISHSPPKKVQTNYHFCGYVLPGLFIVIANKQ